MNSISAFNTDHFNQLPLIESAAAAMAETTAHLTRLGAIFRRCRVERQFGLALLHRHFHIDSGERMVHRIVTGGIESRPERIDNAQAVVWRIENGHAIPIEFADVAPDKLPPFPPEFVAELSAALEADGLSNTLGLVVLSGLFECACHYAEASDEKLRVSVRARRNKVADGIATVWAFDRSSSPDPRIVVVCPACQ